MKFKEKYLIDFALAAANIKKNKNKNIFYAFVLPHCFNYVHALKIKRSFFRFAEKKYKLFYIIFLV